MKELIKKIHNDNFRWYDFWGVSLLITFCAFNLAPYIGFLLIMGVLRLSGIMGVPIDTSDPFTQITCQYMLFSGIWIFIVLVLLLIKPEKEFLAKIGPKTKGNNWRLFLIGIVAGFAANMICIVAALLNKDIAVYFDKIQPLKSIVVFLAVFVQSSAEELVCRGYIYNKLRRGYRHPAVAIIGNALLFGSIHLKNNGVTPLAIAVIVLFGIWASLIVYYFDSIWCAMALHTAWNYTQNVLMGLPNSGIVFDFSIFKLDVASARDSFAYNVKFGVESTIMCLIVMFVGIGLTIFLGQRRKPAQA